jgi:uncharacterized GH25 family protein
MKRIAHFLACLALSLAPVAAHEVWIEDSTEGQLVIRFAEYGEDFEKSPGALDGLGAPTAFSVGDDGKPKGSAADKKADHFSLTATNAKTATHVETAYAVMGGGDKSARKPFFYARWQPVGAGAAKPALTFDLVPTGKPGEARITFRGKPLAAAKATAHLPDGTEQELTADADGLVSVPVEKPGFYMLACKHQRETQNGFWGGRTYDTVSHNCSLTWRVPAKAK